MFRVELLSNSSITATPGWTYVPDRGFDPAKASMAPTLGRKRGIRDAGKGGDISSRQHTAIVRHLAELDRENQRDVQIPVPVKQAKEAGSRGTRAKTTSNVRRILQSQKTFRNHLDDEEAALSAGGGGLPQYIGNASAAAAQTVSKAALTKGGKSAAARRSATPALSASSATTAAVRRKRASTAANTTTTTPSASTTPAPAPPVLSDRQDTEPAATPSATAEEEDDPERKHKLIKSEHDNDPLLRSYAPSAPSDRIMQRLLSEAPLSYNAARAGPPVSGRSPRHFCCMCGYWGKIRCKSCHLRTCGLDCYKVHEDSRCGAFF